MTTIAYDRFPYAALAATFREAKERDVFALMATWKRSYLPLDLQSSALRRLGTIRREQPL